MTLSMPIPSPKLMRTTKAFGIGGGSVLISKTRREVSHRGIDVPTSTEGRQVPCDAASATDEGRKDISRNGHERGWGLR